MASPFYAGSGDTITGTSTVTPRCNVFDADILNGIATWERQGWGYELTSGGGRMWDGIFIDCGNG